MNKGALLGVRRKKTAFLRRTAIDAQSRISSESLRVAKAPPMASLCNQVAIWQFRARFGGCLVC